jgi:DNA-binding transcriptional MerR regulator
MAKPGLSIGAVSKRTGIPVTTLRFYERELPRLFPIRKTAGGHRRYDDATATFPGSRPFAP